jgi:hypothetical protein
MLQVIIFIGVQDTEKNTVYKERFLKTHIPISLDGLKTCPREKVFLDACLQTGQIYDQLEAQ